MHIQPFRPLEVRIFVVGGLFTPSLSLGAPRGSGQILAIVIYMSFFVYLSALLHMYMRVLYVFRSFIMFTCLLYAKIYATKEIRGSHRASLLTLL